MTSPRHSDVRRVYERPSAELERIKAEERLMSCGKMPAGDPLKPCDDTPEGNVSFAS